MASERSSKPSSPPPPPIPEPSAPPDWRNLRLWHIQPVRDILVLAMVFGVLYLGYILRPITIPMLLALMFAYLFEPLVKRMARSRRIGRPGAAIIIIASFFLVVVVPAGIGLGIGIVQGVRLVQNVATNTSRLVAVVQEADDQKRAAAVQALPTGWEGLGRQLTKFRAHIIAESAKRRSDAENENEKGTKPDAAAPGDAQLLPAQPDPAAEPPLKPEAADSTAGDTPQKEGELTRLERDIYTAAYTGIEWVRANADMLARSLGERALVTGQGAVATVVVMVGGLAVLGFGAFLTAFFFFFFSTGWGKVLDFWARLIPERKKGRVFDLLAKMDRVIAGFVRGRLTICVIMSVFFTLGYWFIGVPMPFVIGPLVGLLFIVPFLHILSIPLGIILLWLQPSTLEWQNTWWWIIFAPIGIDVLGQFIDDWVLSPMIQGKTTEMDMPTILFASMAGGALAGMYGLLVAIPVAACIRILFKEVFWPKFRRWARGEERDFLPISSAEDSSDGKG